jgi:putative transport protein
LVLFIFTVGLQVGPSFFASFRKGGLQLNLLAVAIVALGVVTTVMISKLSGETLDVMAGVYSGAISSTPGMSAAQQAVSSTGIGSSDVIANSLPASSYATVYPLTVFMRIFTAQMMVMVAAV